MAEAQSRVAICQEVIDDENLLPCRQEFLQDINIFGFLLGKGSNWTCISILLHKSGLILPGKDQLRAQLCRHRQADGNAGGFHRHHLVKLRARKAAGKFLAHGQSQLGVNLVIEERINLQDIARQAEALFQDSLFQ